MKKLLILLTACILTGCSSLRQVQVVREVSRDTLYLSNVQYDSIYIDNWHSHEYHPSLTSHPSSLTRIDTIYVKDIQYEYKYKFLRDTVYKVQVDTIPVIKTVEVVKTERYVPGIYKWSLAICIILICVFCVFCVLKIKF